MGCTNAKEKRRPNGDHNRTDFNRNRNAYAAIVHPDDDSPIIRGPQPAPSGGRNTPRGAYDTTAMPSSQQGGGGEATPCPPYDPTNTSGGNGGGGFIPISGGGTNESYSNNPAGGVGGGGAVTSSSIAYNPNDAYNDVSAGGGGGTHPHSAGDGHGYASQSENEGDDDALVLICLDCGAEITRKRTAAVCPRTGKLHL